MARFGRRSGAVVAVVSLGVLALAPAAAHAVGAPEARAITVTPSADLDDGQTVTVDGTGWRPGVLVYAIECLVGT